MAMSGTAATDDEIVPVGLQKQLFVDDYVIGDMGGVQRVMHSPEKYADNPVVRGERPWERGLLYPLAVVRDPATGIWHLYYRAISAPPGQEGRESFCYVQSRDGVHWERPDFDFVQLTDEEGGNPNNLIMSAGTPMAIFIRPDEPDAAKRFLGLFAGDEAASVAAWYSPDGLRWEKASDSGDLRGSPTTLANPFARYFYTGQCWAGNNAWGANRRGVMRADTEDLEHWGGNLTIFAAGPDGPENLEFYTMSVADMRTTHTYHGLYLGFLHHFHTDLEGKRHPANDVAMSGPIDVYLVASRDTIVWDWVDRDRPFLPLGPEGEFDSGMVFMGSMIEHQDRLLFYYAGWNVEHGQLIGTPTVEGHAYIGLATLRLDGFASLEADGDEATVTTKSFVLRGDALEVNVDPGGGRLLVEVLEADGAPIPGFTASDCQSITTDGLRQRVTWKEGADLGALKGKTVRLWFYLTRGVRLYAFQVVAAGPAAPVSDSQPRPRPTRPGQS